MARRTLGCGGGGPEATVEAPGSGRRSSTPAARRWSVWAAARAAAHRRHVMLIFNSAIHVDPTPAALSPAPAWDHSLTGRATSPPSVRAPRAVVEDGPKPEPCREKAPKLPIRRLCRTLEAGRRGPDVEADQRGRGVQAGRPAARNKWRGRLHGLRPTATPCRWSSERRQGDVRAWWGRAEYVRDGWSSARRRLPLAALTGYLRERRPPARVLPGDRPGRAHHRWKP
jgi:hypothetical protein